MSIELIPCPFCESEDCEVFPDLACHYVQCNECDAVGPSKDTFKEAVAAWNRRFACEDWQFCCGTCDHKCAIELIEESKE